MIHADQAVQTTRSSRYAKAIEASKRIRWDIDKDVIRGRNFDFSKKFLPDGLSRVSHLDEAHSPLDRLAEASDQCPVAMQPGHVDERWQLGAA